MIFSIESIIVGPSVSCVRETRYLVTLKIIGGQVKQIFLLPQFISSLPEDILPNVKWPELIISPAAARKKTQPQTFTFLFPTLVHCAGYWLCLDRTSRARRFTPQWRIRTFRASLPREEGGDQINSVAIDLLVLSFVFQKLATHFTWHISRPNSVRISQWSWRIQYFAQ